MTSNKGDQVPEPSLTAESVTVSAAHIPARDSALTAHNVRVRQEPRFNLIDGLMLLLALISVVLLIIYTVLTVDRKPSEGANQLLNAIVIADGVICAIFAVDFLWRWRSRDWDRRYLRDNWYDILGMIPLALLNHIPVASPVVRALRLVGIVRLFQAVTRVGGVVDRVFGDEAFDRLVDRLTDPIIAEIKKPITIAILDEIAKVLKVGEYSRNIADALNENHTDLRETVWEKLEHDSRARWQTRWFTYLPFHDDVLRTAIGATLRVVEEVLRDPETNEFVTDAIRNTLEQIKIAVENGQVEIAVEKRQVEIAVDDGTVEALVVPT
jgi:voltage-gated potassium channel